MSARRILLWVLVAVIVLILIAAGVWLFARVGFLGVGGFGFAGRGMLGEGRFFDMPRQYGMMPGYARGIGFPVFGWLGSILVFALGVGVGLILAAIGRRPSNPQMPASGTQTDVPASFEAWHTQLHEREAEAPANKRGRRS
jgi:hypothetical protein